jgi:hypothetical protein
LRLDVHPLDIDQGVDNMQTAVQDIVLDFTEQYLYADLPGAYLDEGSGGKAHEGDEEAHPAEGCGVTF